MSRALLHVAAAVCLVVGVSAAAAHGAVAATVSGSAIISGTFSSTTLSADGTHSVTLEGQFQGTLDGNSSTIEAFGCEAMSGPDAASTGVAQCSLNTVAAPPAALPGPTAATSATTAFGLDTTLAGLQLCGQANATFLDDSTALSAYGCTSAPLASLTEICSLVGSTATMKCGTTGCISCLIVICVACVPCTACIDPVITCNPEICIEPTTLADRRSQ